MNIRQRTPADDAAIYDVVKRAFAGMELASGDEQNLVGRLRKTGGYVPELDLVAEDGGRIAGHVMLTKVEIAETQQLILAPLAVAPECRNRGIGGALIKAGHGVAKKRASAFPCWSGIRRIIRNSDTVRPLCSGCGARWKSRRNVLWFAICKTAGRGWTPSWPCRRSFLNKAEAARQRAGEQIRQKSGVVISPVGRRCKRR